jgi:DNA-binding transcriptional LysR family regulator
LLSLNQLKVFWTVANSTSLTRAAKQLGLSQPSLSQQVAKLEQALGGKLFDRINNQLVLTDAGRFLVRKAEVILAEVDEAQAGVAEFVAGRRGRIAVGAVASLARCLVPAALERALLALPELEIELHELAPVEAIDQLYGRNLQIAILSSYSIATNRISFSKVELGADPYCLAVPKGLALDGVQDPERDLGPAERRLVNRCIQFNFGNQHNQRVEDWWRRVLPRHGAFAWCRTYESALAMVEAGLGVALVPLLTAQLNGRLMFDVDLYRAPGLERPIVALVPPQYRRVEPFQGFLKALEATGTRLPLPAVRPAPPFLAVPAERGPAAAPHDTPAPMAAKAG